jgi:hypothetical protein
MNLPGPGVPLQNTGICRMKHTLHTSLQFPPDTPCQEKSTSRQLNVSNCSKTLGGLVLTADTANHLLLLILPVGCRPEVPPVC